MISFVNPLFDSQKLGQLQIFFVLDQRVLSNLLAVLKDVFWKSLLLKRNMTTLKIPSPPFLNYILPTMVSLEL